jgi:hypothetical protein
MEKRPRHSVLGKRRVTVRLIKWRAPTHLDNRIDNDNMRKETI